MTLDERRCKALVEAAGPLIRALRNGNGVCRHCKAEAGVKHAESCIATPFIRAKADADNRPDGLTNLSTGLARQRGWL